MVQHIVQSCNWCSLSLVLGENNAGTLGLECRDCRRSFSNRRQILKHICLKEVEEEEDEEEKSE